MEPKARYITIGLFTIIGVIATLVIVLWLGKMATDQNWRYYVVEFNESVSGLSRGSEVQFTGLKIGEVTKLELDKEHTNRVYAYIRVSEDIPIYEDVKASLSIVGITGQAVIAMSGGTPNSKELKGEDEDDPDVIKATQSALSQLLSGSGSMVSNLSETMVSVNKLFNEKNIKNMGEIIDHVSTITGAVAAKDEDISATVTSLRRIADSSGEAIKSFQKVANTTDQILNQSGKKAVDSMAQAMVSIQKVSKDIQHVLDQNKGNLANGVSGLQEIGPAVYEFKRSVNTLNSILRSFEKNPGAYLLEGNKLREFHP
ncbi:MlaD family protein [Brackiella oedipodis]|uniref:MlaD family protein n=1 Tax=Brackiella oedipodis TaxID=124225 RepID=UPI00048E2E58|nr:MlaD family protein [Brackiella oedipodis]